VKAGVTIVIIYEIIFRRERNGTKAGYSVMRLPNEHTPSMLSETKVNRPIGFSTAKGHNRSKDECKGSLQEITTHSLISSVLDSGRYIHTLMTQL
jgi:hypothetical protein